MNLCTASAAAPPCAVPLDPEALAAQWREWTSGVGYEIAFWSRWLAQQGGQHAADYRNRIDPELAADPFLEHVVAGLEQARVRVLDVGAGPLCCLGKVSKHAELEITPVDPLADFYDRLLAENGVTPLLRTRFALGEDLALQFPSNAFDMVHCQNALDHSMDPLRVLLQMLEVCRIGGVIMLRHAHDEAEHENYAGFHKWNLTNEGERFVIWNKSARFDVSAMFADFTGSEMLLTEGYLVNLLRKAAEVPRAMFDADAMRMSNLQRAVIATLG